jgi:hypothetical protein
LSEGEGLLGEGEGEGERVHAPALSCNWSESFE